MVAIGGIGGSGTRIVADLFRRAGYFLGVDLNRANDNLLFTLLFKREGILVTLDTQFDLLWEIFKKIMTGKGQLTNPEITTLKMLSAKDRTLHDSAFLRERLNFIDHDLEIPELWGWKEPNTHVVIERILKIETDLQFIYVYRHPLDMAHSSNQSQLNLWGDIFLGQKGISISPKNALKYWIAVHNRMENLRKAYPTRVFLLNFDNVCNDSAKFLRPLEKFINSNLDLARHTGIIKIPHSIGRYKKHSLDCFDEDDVSYIKTLEDLSGC